MKLNALGVGLLAWLMGCTKPPSSVDAGAPVRLAPLVDAGAVRFLSSAQRCSECHGGAFEEWQSSAHAKAVHSDVYAAMRQRAKSDCERCHAPLKGLDEGDWVTGEAISCDACHSLKEVHLTPLRAEAKLDFSDNVKYGPLCDAKAHYFHKMGCSPLHDEAAFCASCHLLYLPQPKGEPLPVYTEYEEWLASDYAQSGIVCQDCHMKPHSAEVAVAAPKRPRVHRHGFWGDGALKKTAVTLELAVKDEAAGKLKVEVTLSNLGAGHKVPTGLPGRRLTLSLESFNEAGQTQERFERSYGRRAGNAEGVEVPYFEATQILADDRLAPNESRKESFVFEAPAAGHLIAELKLEPLSAALAQSLKLAQPKSEVWSTVRVPFGARRAAQPRVGLPFRTKVPP